MVHYVMENLGRRLVWIDLDSGRSAGPAGRRKIVRNQSVARRTNLLEGSRFLCRGTLASGSLLAS
jgi:hypothetical protein